MSLYILALSMSAWRKAKGVPTGALATSAAADFVGACMPQVSRNIHTPVSMPRPVTMALG